MFSFPDFFFILKEDLVDTCIYYTRPKLTAVGVEEKVPRVLQLSFSDGKLYLINRIEYQKKKIYL